MAPALAALAALATGCGSDAGAPVVAGAGRSPVEARPARPAPAPAALVVVVTSQGSPVAGARVVAEGPADRIEGTTGPDGTARFDGVAPGDYRLTIHDAGDATPVCPAGRGCITTRPARAEVRDLRVGPGATAEAVIAL